MMAIKNIIFDLGNVMVTLDVLKSVRAFMSLCPNTTGNPMENPEFVKLINLYSVGGVSTEEFCEQIRTIFDIKASDRQIIDACNMMLVEIPEKKKVKLLELKAQGYHLFFLSNIVDCHWDLISEKLLPYKGKTAEDFVEIAFLSQKMHLVKPDPEIYATVIREAQIEPKETLFIDDRPENCKAAEAFGIKTFNNLKIDDWLIAEP
ncbi:MAG: HAD family phosphatase, partial [Bacteroidales bacterium]|nr:HAD family phosphatase [Bacteroidales bacterium]